MGISQAEYLRLEARLASRRGGGGPEKPEAVESNLHRQILAECRTRGWLCIHSRMDLPSTTAIGTPDFLILADGGRLFLIEAKSKTGKMKPHQLAFKAWAGKLGHPVHVVRSLAEFLELVQTALQPDAAEPSRSFPRPEVTL